MSEQKSEILWSDRWCVEDDKAWFVSGKVNMLFAFNMNTNHYKIITALPGDLDVFRANSNCIKCGETIFCLPDFGDCIWCYNLHTSNFQKIEIANPNHVRLMILDFWKCGDTLWAVSMGLKQIIEINITQKRIVNYYSITEQKNEMIARSTKSENYIYIVSASKGRVYKFNTETKLIEVKELSGVESGMRTISVDGGNIWLSGSKKELYLGDENTDKVCILNEFPSNFGIYNFDGKEKPLLDCETTEYDTVAFLESINVGNYIWFIPFQTNQILYINKDAQKINVFEVEDEEEDEKSIKNREINGKYVLQYVYGDRYIGLYSLKNKIVFEIDAKTLKVKKRFVTIDVDDVEDIPKGWIFKESFGVDQKFYENLIKKGVENVSEKDSFGERIYAQMRHLTNYAK